MGSGVKSIGAHAFDACFELPEITLGENVETIGDSAFTYCRKLKSVTLPEGLISIGENAFYDCRSIERITIPSTVNYIGSYAFKSCDALSYANFKTFIKWRCATWDNPAITGGHHFSSGDILDPNKVAKYLRETYAEYYWFNS